MYGYLVLQERLNRQQEENDLERKRLEDLISRLETQLREQTRMLDEVSEIARKMNKRGQSLFELFTYPDMKVLISIFLYFQKRLMNFIFLFTNSILLKFKSLTCVIFEKSLYKQQVQ